MNIKAMIDGAEVVVVDNKITIKEGLEEWNPYYLSLSDFKTDGCPKVVYDEIEFTIGEGSTVVNNGNDEQWN